jgi:metal-responsive CopG/Arc/MetJ family transcriptional regulator
MSKHKRINISIDPILLKAIDAYCEAHGMTRSAFFAMAYKEYING